MENINHSFCLESALSEFVTKSVVMLFGKEKIYAKPLRAAFRSQFPELKIKVYSSKKNFGENNVGLSYKDGVGIQQKNSALYLYKYLVWYAKSKIDINEKGSLCPCKP
jgi:hypothetical protein